MCILLVEDEPMIREIMMESLQDQGYDVMEACDGPHAFELLAAPPKLFSALVTDYHMPGGIDGVQVAARIRAIIPGVPVVIATGRPDVLQKDWREELGYKLLRKPYRVSELVRLIESLVDLASMPTVV